MIRDPRNEGEALRLMEQGGHSHAWRVGRHWCAPPRVRNPRPRWWQRIVRAIVARL